MSKLISLLRPKTWQIEYLFNLGPSGWLLHVGVVILTALAQHSLGHSIIGWSVIMVALSMLMVAVCHFGRSNKQVERNGYIHTAGTSLVAFGWAYGALDIVDQSSSSILFFTFALGGTALGAVAAQHSVLRSCLASIWLSLPALAFAHARAAPGMAGEANAGMILIYLLVLTDLAFRMHNHLEKNVDLSERLTAQLAELGREREMAENANRAKTRFLAYASHDLRQPVHAIGLLLEALNRRQMDMDSSRIMERIDIATRNLTHLIRSLLDRSAIDLGQMTPQWSAVALARLLRDIADQNRLAAEHSGNAIRVICPDAIVVSCDRALLTNMVQNLLTNAIRHAPDSVILIGARRRGATISIVVCDRGPGIAPEDQERIFEEFQVGGNPADTAAPRATAMPRSFGLGLPLVRQLAVTMDLSVTMTSKPGRGTLFFIGGLKPANSGADPGAHPSDVHPLNGVTVLVVDDDIATLEAIAPLLQGWGCQVIARESPPTAIPSQCGVVITDWQLGDGTDAGSFVSRLRSDPEAPYPVLIVSGANTEMIAAGLRSDPGVLILEKPARPAQLRAALTSLLIARR